MVPIWYKYVYARQCKNARVSRSVHGKSRTAQDSKKMQCTLPCDRSSNALMCEPSAPYRREAWHKNVFVSRRLLISVAYPARRAPVSLCNLLSEVRASQGLYWAERGEPRCPTPSCAIQDHRHASIAPPPSVLRALSTPLPLDRASHRAPPLRLAHSSPPRRSSGITSLEH